MNDTRGLSGIYLILNKVTLDYYIGSASTGKFHARFSNHLFNFHGSKVVKNAVKIVSLSSFAFIVLELFPERSEERRVGKEFTGEGRSRWSPYH